MDGKPVPSCMVLTVECDGKRIMTAEGSQDLKILISNFKNILQSYCSENGTTYFEAIATNKNSFLMEKDKGGNHSGHSKHPRFKDPG